VPRQSKTISQGIVKTLHDFAAETAFANPESISCHSLPPSYKGIPDVQKFNPFSFTHKVSAFKVCVRIVLCFNLYSVSHTLVSVLPLLQKFMLRGWESVYPRSPHHPRPAHGFAGHIMQHCANLAATARIRHHSNVALRRGTPSQRKCYIGGISR